MPTSTPTVSTLQHPFPLPTNTFIAAVLWGISITPNFTIFPSTEMGQQRHANRFKLRHHECGRLSIFINFGTDSILNTQSTGYPTQMNHPGITDTEAEVIQNQGYGADFSRSA